MPRELLSIGDAARASGLSVDTIRVWERRYRRPRSLRLSSGHRRYEPEQVLWLRRMVEALALGYKPAELVALDDLSLCRLLETAQASESEHDSVPLLFDHVRALEHDKLLSQLYLTYEALGPREFVEYSAGPLMTKVGRAWVDGKIGVRHEHFLTEVLEDFLRSARQALHDASNHPPLVLATLQGEPHGLGLQLAALICALHRVPVHNLGTNIPHAEILQAVGETQARGVAISVSLATGGVETDRLLLDLRHELPSHVSLVVGGRGARGVRRGPRRIDYVKDFRGFEKWLEKTLGAELGPPHTRGENGLAAVSEGA
ncbi:MAG: MerR family transcriptional regulator [Planctomycetota bacterium]